MSLNEKSLEGFLVLTIVECEQELYIVTVSGTLKVHSDWCKLSGTSLCL